MLYSAITPAIVLFFGVPVVVFYDTVVITLNIGYYPIAVNVMCNAYRFSTELGLLTVALMTGQKSWKNCWDLLKEGKITEEQKDAAYRVHCAVWTYCREGGEFPQEVIVLKGMADEVRACREEIEAWLRSEQYYSEVDYPWTACQTDALFC